jgi:hypothetical protein
MATGLGFCPTCGTARNAAEQKFCATCGTALAVMAVPEAPTPPAPVEATPPPPPAWAAPSPVEAAPPPPWAAQTAVPTPPPAPPIEAAPPPPPAWAAQTQVAPPPPPSVDYAPPPPPAWGGQAVQGYQPAPPPYAMPAPVGPTQTKSRISPAILLLAVLLIGAVAGGAYLVTNNNSKGGAGASSAITAGPGGTSGPVGTAHNGATTQPDVTTQPGDNTGLAGAANNFSNITSYKFSMTLAGGEFGSMLSAIPGAASSGNAPFTMSGTVVTSPDKAADINLAGFHMIEVGGFDYLDMSGGGTFYKTPVSGSSLADSFSPETMFSSAMDTSTSSGYAKVGSGTKNGVAADHYQASAADLSAYGSSLGITGATWSSDIWIAQKGGFPVSMSIIAVASDKSIAYQIVFDLTNINDPANKVTAPANAIGL